MIHIVFIFSGEILAYGCYVEGYMIKYRPLTRAELPAFGFHKKERMTSNTGSPVLVSHWRSD